MTTRLINGDRVGRMGNLRFGCSGTLFDKDRQKVLLTRRTDNQMWCLPGGAMDPGESAEEACVREFLEETGLQVRVVRLVGIYSSPDWLVEYPDGNRAQIVAVNFEVEKETGELQLNREVNEFGYFGLEEIADLDLMLHQRQRIEDAFAGKKEAFIR